MLDELIHHLNSTKSTFNFLILTSFIIAPLALIVAAIFILYPRFLFFMLERVPQVGAIIIIFVAISVILAATWLAIGVKERAFFGAWNRRFDKYISLKEQIDRQLVEGERDGHESQRTED